MPKRLACLLALIDRIEGPAALNERGDDQLASNEGDFQFAISERTELRHSGKGRPKTRSLVTTFNLYIHDL
jgi:hypothetical protein